VRHVQTSSLGTENGETRVPTVSGPWRGDDHSETIPRVESREGRITERLLYPRHANHESEKAIPFVLLRSVFIRQPFLSLLHIADRLDASFSPS